MRPHAVDANAIHKFQEERIRDESGLAHACIEAITANDCIALDEGGLCLQEWIECAGGKFPFALTDWVADQAVIGKIRYYPLVSNNVRKHLLSLGLPNKDHKWVRLAIGSEGRIIVTNDVDFFDPTKKNASSASKQEVKAKGSGPCSKALLKEYGVTVRCVDAFIDD